MGVPLFLGLFLFFYFMLSVKPIAKIPWTALIASPLVWKPDGSSLIIAGILKSSPSWCSLGKNKQCATWSVCAPLPATRDKEVILHAALCCDTQSCSQTQSVPSASLCLSGSSVPRHAPVSVPSWLTGLGCVCKKVVISLFRLVAASIKALWVLYLLNAELLSAGVRCFPSPSCPWLCRQVSQPCAEAGKLVLTAALQSRASAHLCVLIKIFLQRVSGPSSCQHRTGRSIRGCWFYPSTGITRAIYYCRTSCLSWTWHLG